MLYSFGITKQMLSSGGSMATNATAKSSWVSAVTAVSTTIAATLLLGFIGTVKDLVYQAPLISSQLQQAGEKLNAIEVLQDSQSLAISNLTSSAPTRDMLQREVEKLDDKIRALQVQQALLLQRIDQEIERYHPDGR